jgi:hypothetical protein
VVISALNGAGQPYAHATFPVDGTGRFPLVLQPKAGQQQPDRFLGASAGLEDPVFPGSCPDGRSLPSGWSLSLPGGATINAADPNRHSRDSVDVCDGAIARGAITLNG